MASEPLPKPVRAAIKAAGSKSELARRLGINRQAIDFWGSGIPLNRVIQVEKVTGLHRAKLRPDLFGVKA